MQDESQVMSIEGVVRFVSHDEGSKSERIAPVLECGADRADIPVYMKNDNPFENTSLRGYEGLRVRVIGVMRNGTFVAESVETI